MKSVEYTFVMWPSLNTLVFNGLAPANKYVNELNDSQTVLKLQIIFLKLERTAFEKNIRFIKRMLNRRRLFSTRKISIINLCDHVCDEIDIGLNQDYHLLDNLESLHLCKIKIAYVSNVFTKLKGLHLDATKDHPRILYDLPDDLEKLYVRDMDWRWLEEQDKESSLFKRFLSIKKLSITLCLLSRFPKFNEKLDSLYMLNLQHNYISVVPENAIPPTVMHLNLAFNRIERIWSLPKSLLYVDVKYNLLKQLPWDTLLCDHLMMIHFDGNPLLPCLPLKRKIQELKPCAYFEVIRAIHSRRHRLSLPGSSQDTRRRFPSDGKTMIYADKQNIHDNTIQKSFLVSTYNLFVGLNDTIVFVGCGNKDVDALLLNWFRYNDRHTLLRITFKELFFSVWFRISNMTVETRSEAVRRLCQELLEAQGKCFVGLLTRTVNSLVGFCDDIRLNVSTADQVYTLIKRHIDQHSALKKEILVKELEHLDLSPQRIDEWISAFEDQ